MNFIFMLLITLNMFRLRIPHYARFEVRVVNETESYFALIMYLLITSLKLKLKTIQININLFKCE